MHGTRTAAAAAAAAVLLVGLGSASAGQPLTPSTPQATPPEVSVVELDLDGVVTSEVAALPAEPPLPEESAPLAAGATPSAADLTTGSQGAPAVTNASFRRGSTQTPGPVDGATAPTSPEPTGAETSPAAGATTPPSTAPAPGSPRTPSPDPSSSLTPVSPSPDATPQDEDTPPADPDVLTRPMTTAPFSVLGLSWDATATDVVVRFRVLSDGEWSPWQAVGASDIAPDAGSPEADDDARAASDAVVAIDSSGLQVWAEAEAGTVTGLKAVLIDPGDSPADARVAPAAAPRVPAGGGGLRGASVPADATTGGALVVPASYPVPSIVRRSAWGADESLVTCRPDVSTSVVAGVVHHTASTNAYSAADVPGLLRGFLAYHTRPESAGGRGWCDIGYNFLVDRFGRIFEGRAGSIDQTVVGVHTGGFNSRTVGVAAVGEYGAAGTPVEMLEAISQTFAWKFAQLRVPGSGSVTLVSGGGASKYPAGTTVVMPTIFGHRDAQTTSCPGQNLYGSLPSIRARVSQLVDVGVTASPFGNWERTSVSAQGIEVTGWVHDPDTRGPIGIVVDVDGSRTQVPADRARPDVAAAYATAGPAHGFTVRAPLRQGPNVVCLWAVNVGGGYDTSLGCRSVSGANADPVGFLDHVSATSTTITARGWAFDPDTTAPVGVHLYVDGTAHVLVADQPRPDVGAAFGRDDRLGFALTIPATGGAHQVCAYAINTPAGTNPTLGCRSVTVQNAPPQGWIDAVATSADSVTVSGWTFDPDSPDPIDVHVYLDGVGRAVRADGARPDVGGVFGRGERSGFTATLPAGPGRHQMCVYAINTPAGANTTLGCRAVDVADTPPMGNLEAIVGDPGRIAVWGWAFDPDTTSPIAVHVYVDGVGRALRADLTRPDVSAAFGRLGGHGFAATFPAAPGRHSVCVYAIGVPAGNNPTLGCSVVTT